MDETQITPVVVGVAMMDQAEARAYLEMMRDDLHTIDGAIGNFRARALDFKEREGWRALGYAGYIEAIQTELGAQYSKSYLSRLLKAAEIERVLELPIGNSVPESQLRPLAGLPPEQQRQAYAAAGAATGGQPTAKAVQQAVDEITPGDGRPTDAERGAVTARWAALGYNLQVQGLGRYILFPPDHRPGIANMQWQACVERLEIQEQKAAALIVGQRAEPNKADPKEPPPALLDIPADIRAAAGRYELLITRQDDGLILHWPEETFDELMPQSFEAVRAWLADEAPRAALVRLDRTMPKALQAAGYYWHSASPAIIAHNDGWRGDAPTVESALGLAYDRARAKIAQTVPPPAPAPTDPRSQAIGLIKQLCPLLYQIQTEDMAALTEAINALAECVEGGEASCIERLLWAYVDMEVE